MKTYKIKSVSGQFPSFSIIDEELGYLDMQIEEEIFWLSKKQVRLDQNNDVLIRPVTGKKDKWYKIVYKPNSTEYHLEHKEILEVT